MHFRPCPERYTRPDWVRRINLMGDSVGGRPQDLVPIDAGELLKLATDSLGGMPAGDLGRFPTGSSASSR